jgi:hypothetical protein
MLDAREVVKAILSLVQSFGSLAVLNTIQSRFECDTEAKLKFCVTKLMSILGLGNLR